MTWKGFKFKAIAKSRTTIGGRTVTLPLLPGTTCAAVDVGRETTGVMGGRGIDGIGDGRLGSALAVVGTILTGGKSARGAGRGGSGGGVGADLNGGTILGGVEEVAGGLTRETGGIVGFGASTLTTGTG